jgi:hypothetical protein
MKWSYHSQATPAAARLLALRSRFGRTQQLVALALTLSLCILALLAVSGRVNLSPTPTPLPTAQTQPVLFPPTLAPAFTSAPIITNTRTVGPLATALPQAAPFNCGTGTAEVRYVADRSGALVFDRVDAGATTLGTLAFRASVQVYGTVPGRLTGNSDKWYAVKYGTRCAYIWADPANSRLSTTQPR